MRNSSEIIASGILTKYVLEQTTGEQDLEIKLLADIFPEIRQEINRISAAFEAEALQDAVTPDPIIKPFLLATIDYMTRMEAGEEFTVLPVMTSTSAIADYEQWLNHPDVQTPAEFSDVHARILSYTPELISAVVWIKYMAPEEVHTAEYEKFLILEGTCDITIEEEVYSLKRGDCLTIPLHKNHFVTVTSAIPCKVLLQRVAA